MCKVRLFIALAPKPGQKAGDKYYTGIKVYKSIASLSLQKKRAGVDKAQL